MTWGTVQVGRIRLRETLTVGESGTGDRRVQIAGQESCPPLTRAEVVARHDDLLALLPDQVVPVTWTDKPERNGYYLVASASCEMTDWQADPVISTWRLDLQRIGTPNEVDLQSRLPGTIRANDFGLTGERWHAPPIGHDSYYSGSTVPSTMTRATTDGTMTVYRSIPSGASPRWGCQPDDYLAGRVRILSEGIERSGIDLPVSASAWELSNGLVRVVPGTVGGATFDIQSYTGGSWRSKYWDVFPSASDIVYTHEWASVHVLRNEPELCILRFTSGLNPGRVTVDLTLRRGSRFVEGYVQRSSSEQIKVRLTNAESYTDSTASSGYVTASSNDAAGNRFVIGSARSCFAHANGGIGKDSTTALDFYVGVAAGGSSAVSGDAATDLRNQYIGALPELVSGVRR